MEPNALVSFIVWILNYFGFWAVFFLIIQSFTLVYASLSGVGKLVKCSSQKVLYSFIVIIVSGDANAESK